jgi:hypothetical protein
MTASGSSWRIITVDKKKLPALVVRAVVVTLLLYSVNLLSSAYYAQKVNFILYQTAEHIAAIASWNCNINQYAVPGYLEREARTMANRLLSEAGLPSVSQLSVDQKKQSVIVTAALEGFPQLKNNVFPTYLVMKESLTVDLPDCQPPALLDLSAGRNHILLPSYGKYIPEYTESASAAAVAKAPPGTALLRPFLHRYAVFTVNLPDNAAYSETLETFKK